jgi:uncharacterized protein involved in exopolysaccharide biosynthesis
MTSIDPIDDQIDLHELLGTLWEGRWVIIGVTGACTVLAVIAALVATPIYRSEALVQIRSEGRAGSSQLGALAAQFVDLGDLPAFSATSGGERAVTLATLQSRTLIGAYLHERNLLQRLYEEKWDPVAKQWKAEPPSIVEAVRRFKEEVLVVSEDRKTGLVTVGVEWEDPKEAQLWVTELVARADQYLREKAIAEGERNLAYLHSQAKQTAVVDLQKALFGLIEAEQGKLMLAKGGEEYAILTIDRATVPDLRIHPKRKRMVLIGFGAGAVLSLVFVLMMSAYRRSGASRQARAGREATS